MKRNFIVVFSFVFLSFFFSLCKGNSDKAMQYNNAIAVEMQYLADIEKEIALKDGPELDIVIAKFKKAVPESKSKIEQLGKFEDDESLQKAAIAICNFYQEVIDGKWSDKGQEAIQNKDEELDKELQKKQDEFAAKFKFEIKR